MNDKKIAIFRQRLPFQPLLVCGIIGILAAHFSGWTSWGWMALTVVFAALFFLTRRQILLSLLIATVFAFVHTWQSRESAAAEFARLLPSPSVVEVVGTVSNEPRLFSGRSATFQLRVTSLRWQGVLSHPAITLQVDWPGPPPAYGDEIRAHGLIEKLEPPRNPGQFDFSRWAALQGIYNRLRVDNLSETEILSHHNGNPLVVLANHTRSWMRQTLTAGVNDPLISDLLIGMVLGDVSDMPDQVQEQFRGTGTFHLFSVSGLHVSIIAVLFWTVGRVFCMPRRILVIATIGLVFFYVLITGLKAASIRSAIMASIVLFGLMAERKPVLLNNLLAAGFLILLVNTNDLFNPGFQFSFCVVAAILLLAKPLTRWMEKPFQPDPFLPEKLRSPSRRLLAGGGTQFATLAAVSIAAWCGSLPLSLGYFHLISLTSLPANMVAVPVSFGIMAVGMLALGCGVVSTSLAVIYNQTNWLLTKILLGAVSFFASLPGSFFYIRLPETSPPLAEIVVFDLGAGGTTWIGTSGSSWLIDCGPAFTHDNVLLPFLRSQGLRRLDGLLLTDVSAGHAGAAFDLFTSCPPKLVAIPLVKDGSSLALRLDHTIVEKNLPVIAFLAGEEFSLSPSGRIESLLPALGFNSGMAGENTAVLRVEVGDIRILLLADAGPATEKWLLRNCPDQLAADILIKGSSRHRPVSSESFLAAVSPQVVVIGAVEYQDIKTSEAFAHSAMDKGISFFRQNETGAVTVRIFPERCEVSGFLNNQRYEFHEPSLRR